MRRRLLYFPGGGAVETDAREDVTTADRAPTTERGLLDADDCDEPHDETLPSSSESAEAIMPACEYALLVALDEEGRRQACKQLMNSRKTQATVEYA